MTSVENTPEDIAEYWQNASAVPHFHISEDGQVFAVAEVVGTWLAAYDGPTKRNRRAWERVLRGEPK